jgi:hypothetical protein
MAEGALQAVRMLWLVEQGKRPRLILGSCLTCTLGSDASPRLLEVVVAVEHAPPPPSVAQHTASARECTSAPAGGHRDQGAAGRPSNPRLGGNYDVAGSPAAQESRQVLCIAKVVKALIHPCDVAADHEVFWFVRACDAVCEVELKLHLEVAVWVACLYSIILSGAAVTQLWWQGCASGGLGQQRPTRRTVLWYLHHVQAGCSAGASVSV